MNEVNATPDTTTDISQPVQTEAMEMLKNPDLISQIIHDVNTLGVAGEENLIATIYLIGVSRLLNRPLAGIVQASSSSGKSYVVSTTAKLFPPESKLIATQITPQALFYLPPGSIKNKLVIVGERSRREDDDTAEGTRALREMLSEGRLSKYVTLKNGGNHETKHIEQEGPIAYIETTTQQTIFNEDANRCLLLSTDETSEQTRRIMVQSAKAKESYRGKTEHDKIMEKHHAIQRLLQPRNVVIPFAGKLAELFPKDRLESRRAFQHTLSMIEACTLLHQHQRPVNEQSNLIASSEDYQIAKRLLAIPFSRTLGKRISEGARRFFQFILTKRILANLKVPISFSVSEIEDYEGKTEKTLRNYLKELSTAGYVVETAIGRGRIPAQWTVVKETIDDSDLVNLPNIAMICEKEVPIFQQP